MHASLNVIDWNVYSRYLSVYLMACHVESLFSFFGLHETMQDLQINVRRGYLT